MNRKLLYTFITALLLLVNITACTANNDNNLEPDDDVNYRPVRYNQNNDDVDLDTNPRDVRDVKQPGEMDTPFNMDEEEPDPDEEPSEERRGD
ncbi:hypothetical protein M3175_22575 [Robertmurraya korlensis]|uniref:hypothetical protein n=1 Tax=Robertmurraya korlensis TaxID=519977 RepID=UPI00203DD52F|nr:hypothetical protein [Robertmurraya korlensis]MCM3603482.1 hypothetical protein [Robertmurraya korlensis]